MKWEGEAIFGPSMIVFTGISATNVVHAMPVTVLAIGHEPSTVILDRDGRGVGGAVCMVRPMTPHIVAPDRKLTIAFLSPGQWSLAGAPTESGGSGFVSIEPEPFRKVPDMDLASAHEVLCNALEPRKVEKDARLDAAIRLLAEAPGTLTIREVAGRVGLSPARMRAIAKRDLGISLSQWLLWKKLEQASQSVADGDGLAQSATSGGFFDQAHFTNAMRRLLGAAPSEIAPVRKAG